MFKIKERKIWILIAVYGILSVIFHMFFMEMGLGDDNYFANCLNDMTLVEYWVKRWNTWSSRLVIETVLVGVMKQPIWIWKCFDILFSVLLAYCFFGMQFYKKKAGNLAYIAFFFLLLYDFREMDSAGYVTTTIFYWWGLAAAMLAFLPLYFHYLGEKVNSWLYLVGVPCAVFAANQEQMALIFFCTAIYFLGIYCFEKREIPKYVYVLLVIAVGCLAIAFLCPGNAVRKNANIDFWFPQYAEFHLLQKGLLGWYGVLRTLYEDMNWLFFAFTAILLLAVWKKSRRWYEKVIGAVPFFSNLALLICIFISRFYDAGPVNKVVHAFDFDQPIVYYHGSLPNKLRLLMALYTFACLCVVLSMYILWGASKKFSHLLAVLVIGTISKMSMGMSPTVWASAERTSIFLLFSFMVIAIQCGQELLGESKDRIENRLYKKIAGIDQ